MKTKIASVILLLAALGAFGQQVVQVSNVGVLQYPTNFFVANSNALVAVSGSGGGGSTALLAYTNVWTGTNTFQAPFFVNNGGAGGTAASGINGGVATNNDAVAFGRNTSTSTFTNTFVAGANGTSTSSGQFLWNGSQIYMPSGNLVVGGNGSHRFGSSAATGNGTFNFALYGSATNTDAIALGRGANTGTRTNNVAIGFGATGTADNQVVLGTATDSALIPGSLTVGTNITSLTLGAGGSTGDASIGIYQSVQATYVGEMQGGTFKNNDTGTGSALKLKLYSGTSTALGGFQMYATHTNYTGLGTSWKGKSGVLVDAGNGWMLDAHTAGMTIDLISSGGTLQVGSSLVSSTIGITAPSIVATNSATFGTSTNQGITVLTKATGSDVVGHMTLPNLLNALAITNTSTVGIVIDGGGSAITAGVKGYVSVPYACTITGARLLADQTGSIVIDVWKDTYANYPPTVADTITASAKPTLSSANKSDDVTLTGWTKSIAAGDVIGFNVDSASTVTRVTLQLTVIR